MSYPHCWKGWMQEILFYQKNGTLQYKNTLTRKANL